MTEVLIAGAGIGGLTTALALHRKGIDVTVVERAARIRPVGVGINLLPHAVRELHELGLGRALAEVSVAPHSIRFYADDGALLYTEKRGVDGGYGHPQLSVHRGTLQQLLLGAVRDRLGADAIRAGSPVSDFADDGRRVRVRCAGAEFDADVFVGADGVASTVRAGLHPTVDPLLWSGVRMYRGAAAMQPFLDGRTMAIIKGDKGTELVAYSIGAQLVNWIVLVQAGVPGPLRGDASWNAPATAEDVLPHLADWRLDWLKPAEMIAATDRIFSYPMVDRDVLPSWGRGRITLLGDAAHPMYPVGANGGSQAIIDARVLADALAAHGVDGLRDYERRRRSETADVIAANRTMHTARATRSPDELARITTDYRTATARSTRA
jgi:2-polyprenyl-6-methoxyphenol hydroxylase-like FAD-dependent oxidoreductase